jgi:hypothetical protein
MRIKAIFLLVGLLISSVGAVANLAQTDSQTEAVRAKVAKYGVGKKVTVTLRDSTKIRGKIGSIDQDGFSLEESGSDTSRSFTYDEVGKIKKASNTKWIVIGVAAGAAAVVGLVLLDKRCRNEGSTTLCL